MNESEEIKVEEIPQEKALAQIKSNVDYLIELAINKDLDVDKLEKLLQMKEHVDSEKARVAFNNAMMKFQSECPVIKKVKPITDKNGVLLYSYAPIENIITQKVSS